MYECCPGELYYQDIYYLSSRVSPVQERVESIDIH